MACNETITLLPSANPSNRITSPLPASLHTRAGASECVTMKEIKLTQGKVAIVDDSDHEWLSQYSWSFAKVGYAARGGKNLGRRFGCYMHRQIMNPTKGFEVDHKNGNKLDNRRSNLRICTSQQNKFNHPTHRNNKLGIKGVSLLKSGKFLAQIMSSGRNIYLGTHKTAALAHEAYRNAATKMRGEFARFK